METGAERLEAQADRLRRASSFGAAAAQYAQHRPGYAEAAIRWCLAPVSGAQPVQVGAQPVRAVDVGAGTGILTGALARLGADVVAVEPDQAMRAELRRRLPGVRAVAGSAEALPLPDQSADAVLCGQAMHWFDPSAASRPARSGDVRVSLCLRIEKFTTFNVTCGPQQERARRAGCGNRGGTALSSREE